MGITLKEIQTIAKELKSERVKIKKRYVKVWGETPDDFGYTKGIDALVDKITERS